MRSARSLFLVLLTLATMAAGNAGLRVLHLSTGCEAAVASADGGCDHHCHHDDVGEDGGDDGHDGDDGDGAPAPAEECATCELLLALAGLVGERVAAPTFHGLVAVRDAADPARRPAPAPIRALAARPPPSC